MSVKKRIKPGKIEPSADGHAIVVHFTNEITHLDEDGLPLSTEKSPDQREVNVHRQLRGLREQDIPAFAQDIVEKCRYIPATKTRQVEQVLLKLLAEYSPHKELDRHHGHHHNHHHKNGHSRSTSRTNRESLRDVHGSVSPVVEDDMWHLSDILPEAHIANVDDYAEELYEEQMEAKALGARRILRLCTDASLLDRISEHPTLLGVLSRELRENAKRSHELTVAITGIFLCLAHFSQFHGILVRHQCNEVTMRVVEYESKRRAALTKELELTRGRVVACGSQVSREDQRNLEREERRYHGVLDRQDRLLQICLLVLRNFAEDTAVEKMLVSRKICHFLIRLLDRNAEDLLFVTLGFIHKLVAFEENKDSVVQHPGALVRLAELAAHPNSAIALLALRVCFNISFDHRAHHIFARQTPLLSTIVAATKRQSVRKIALKLLYQLSMDPIVRVAMADTATDCITLSLHLLVNSHEPRVEKDAAALCVNLAGNHKCAAFILENDMFPRVVSRAVQFGDPLLLKILRHLSSHAALRPRLLQTLRADTRGGATWLHELVVLTAATSATSELLVEAIGILSNLDCQTPEVPWPELCEAGLLDVLHRLLMVGFADDDVLLECIMLTGTLSLDAETIPLLASSKVPAALPNLLEEKREDCDILVQLLFTLRCLLLKEDTCEVLLQETDVPDQILDLLREVSGQDAPSWRIVRASAEETLDFIVVADRNASGSLWAERIKQFRFEIHNDEWCQRLRAVERPQDMKSAASAGTGYPATETKGGLMRWTDTSGLADRYWSNMPISTVSAKSLH